MSMVNERQPFVLRCAVLYCFQCFLYKNQKGQGEIVATLLPSTIDGQLHQAANFISVIINCFCYSCQRFVETYYMRCQMQHLRINIHSNFFKLPTSTFHKFPLEEWMTSLLLNSYTLDFTCSKHWQANRHNVTQEKGNIGNSIISECMKILFHTNKCYKITFPQVIEV